MSEIYLIFGEDFQMGEMHPHLYSIWQHREDALAEIKRLKMKFGHIDFLLEKFDVNQPSDAKIF